MRAAEPITVWAVIAKNSRAEWIVDDTIRKTRKATREAYNGGPNKPDWYANGKKNGYLRLAKVIVTEAP